MATEKDDWFDGIEDSETAGEDASGQWFLEGNYTVEIQKVKKFKTRKGEKTIIIETKILESDNEKRKPGARADCMLMKRWDSFLPSLKRFVVEAMKLDLEKVKSKETEIDKKSIDHICSDANPFKGKRLRVEAVNITTQAGGNFTKCIWARCAEEKASAAA